MNKLKNKKNTVLNCNPVLKQPIRKSHFNIYASGFIFCFAFLLYSNTLHHQWVLDDYGAFKNNIYVTKGVDGFNDILTKTYRHGSGMYSDNLYRPLSQLMFALEWDITPDNPSFSHLINVIFFALTCVLLFAFLRKILQNYSPWISLFIVLLYAAHPIHTEVVANIKSRDEIMSFLFITLTFIFVFNALKATKISQKILYFIGLFVCYTLAMFSKESAITALCIIPLSIYLFSESKIKQYIPIMLLLCIGVGIYLIARHTVLSHYPDSDNYTVAIVDNYFYDSDLVTGWATAIMLLGKYLLLMIIPYPLVCDYSFAQLPTTQFNDFSTLISLIIYLALLLYSLILLRRKKALSFGILFFLISISIYSNLFVRIGSSFAERFLYVPSLGFCIAIVLILNKLIKERDIKKSIHYLSKNPILSSIVIVIIITFSSLTVSRAADWKDQYTLFKTDIQKSENSAHLRLYWGLALRDKGYELLDKNLTEKDLTKVNQNKEKYLELNKKATQEFQKAIEIYPEYALALEQLGVLYMKRNEVFPNPANMDTAETYFLQSLKYVPNVASVNSNLAKIYFERNELTKAKQYYLTSIQLDPIFADGYFNLGSTYGMLAQYDSSLYYFNKCLEIDPTKTKAYTYMGLTYSNLKQYDKAFAMFDKAIETDEKEGSTYLFKLRLLIQLNRWNEAENFANRAVEHNPINSEVYLLRGKVNNATKHYEEALQDLNTSIQYNRNQIEAYIGKAFVFQALNIPDSARYYQKYLNLK